MERITYRITLDAHRNGIQRTLQGFETADKVSRRIAINLVAGGDTFDLPMTNVVAMMYVTTPNATTPDIHECVIEGNTIIYDVAPIVEEGITEMQLKLVDATRKGANGVLIAPRFVCEVFNSNTGEGGATQTQTFTALENAVAKAEWVYNSRILRVVVEDDCTFRVYYADGTVYENTHFKEALYNGNALLSKSYAMGDTGIREGEDTDNSQYYSNVSRSASEDAQRVYEESNVLLAETQLQANYTHFELNFATGCLGYISSYCDFSIDKESGQLHISKDPTYTPEDVILEHADGLLEEKTKEITDLVNSAQDEIRRIGDSADEKLSHTEELLEEAERTLDDAIVETERYRKMFDEGASGQHPVSDGNGGIVWKPSEEHQVGNAVLRYESDPERLVITFV